MCPIGTKISFPEKRSKIKKSRSPPSGGELPQYYIGE